MIYCHYCLECADSEKAQQIFIPSYGTCFICENCVKTYYQEVNSGYDKRY